MIRISFTGCLVAATLCIGAACTPAPRYRSEEAGQPRRPAHRTASARKPKTRFEEVPTRREIDAIGRKARKGMVIVGIASFYGTDFHGKLTANGEIFDMYGVTAAHKTLPLNTVVRVTNLANKKNLIVRINDRGPYVAGRILDLSYGAALKLGFVSQGTAKVRIEVMEIGDNEYMKHLPKTP